MPQTSGPKPIWTLSKEDNDTMVSFRDSMNKAFGITSDSEGFQNEYARNVFMRYLSAKAGEAKGRQLDTTLLLSIYSGEEVLGEGAPDIKFVLGVDTSSTAGDFVEILNNPQRLNALEFAAFYFSGNLVDRYFRVPREQRRTGPLTLFMQAYEITEPDNDEIVELISEIDSEFIFLDEFFYDIPKGMASDQVGVGSRDIYGNFAIFARCVCLLKFFNYSMEQILDDYDNAIKDAIRHDGADVVNLIFQHGAIDDAKSYLESVVADFDKRVPLVADRIKLLTCNSHLDLVAKLHQLGRLNYDPMTLQSAFDLPES